MHPRSLTQTHTQTQKGSSTGIRAALALTRPLGTLVLKSTVSPHAATTGGADAPPNWAELANAIVVDEKALVGSRCGPIGAALAMMARHAELRALLNAMVSEVFGIERGEEAMTRAAEKGVLKVQVVFDESGGEAK